MLQMRFALRFTTAVVASMAGITAIVIIVRPDAVAVAPGVARAILLVAVTLLLAITLIAVLMTSESPSLIVVSRSQDLSLDTGEVLKPLLDRFGGKGGGKGAMAQGGGLTGDVPEILSVAKEHVRSLAEKID